MATEAPIHPAQDLLLEKDNEAATTVIWPTEQEEVLLERQSRQGTFNVQSDLLRRLAAAENALLDGNVSVDIDRLKRDAVEALAKIL
ncbi:uncharacterized protein TRUGW13939_08807 [Talaromyces rugulosus]|uniref:Uncharacterized protein n=1 Tax=Talaromyces rugulosus TaxID=121627 RepID=A0A7H8R7R3_TALRU|nr:uncharacterized protein TRUGW13939_08807 [Talaromyces rugulosus]QKX61655.1 hypothetical protein TRUGW13939_08807 [Talaromyces rugulosus]